MVTKYVDKLMFRGEESNGTSKLQTNAVQEPQFIQFAEKGTHASASTKLQMNYERSFNKVVTKQSVKYLSRILGIEVNVSQYVCQTVHTDYADSMQ